MTRIIPNYEVNTRKSLPKWFNPLEVIKAGKKTVNEIKGLTKQASKPTTIIASYLCAPCNKVWMSSHTDFIKQATIAKRANKEFEPTCPKCGNKVQPYKETIKKETVSNLQTLSQEKKINLRESHVKVSDIVGDEDINYAAGNDFIEDVTESKEVMNFIRDNILFTDDVELSQKLIQKFNIDENQAWNLINTYKQVFSSQRKISLAKGTYNTFIDRKIFYEVTQKLADYARDKGMTACVARYVKGDHRKEAGNDLSTINNVECNLEWMYGRKQKGRATATVKIDEAGKFEFPRVFKVASGMEYPFEEKYIRKLEREPAMFQSLPARKKSDVPTFRRPDPSRFRVTGSMKIGEYMKDEEEEKDEEKKEASIKKVKDVK